MKQAFCWQHVNIVSEGEELPTELAFPGTSLLETIAVRAGKPVWLERHLARICRAALELWNSEFQPVEMLPEFSEILRTQEGRLRCLLFADGSSAWTFQAEHLSCRPMRVTLLEVPQPLGCYKTGKRARHTEMLQLAEKLGADEALLVQGAEVLEGTFTNFLMHDQSGWLTPPLDGRILPGIMRTLILQHLYHTQEPVQEEVVTVERLQGCDRLLLCNSLRGIIPVSALRLQSGLTIDFPLNRLA